MKKKILGMALIAISLVAFNGMAQNPSSDDNTPKKENVRRGDKAGKQSRRERTNPFEGLNLTEAQQTQLAQLDSQRKATRQQQAQARKEEKQRKHSARKAQRSSEVKAYLDKVKAIIGPEQYVVFLENSYVNGRNSHSKAMKKGSRKGGHGFAKEKGCKDRQHKGDMSTANTKTPRTRS